MEYFYAPGAAVGLPELPEEEAAHCFRVMRKKRGDEIALLDGKGGRYRAEIKEISKRGCSFSVLEKSVDNPPQFKIGIAIAPTKNASRFEWFLEKATELGVDRIFPIVCRRSERRKWKAERWERILIAAMKQSGRSFLPHLEEQLKFEQALLQNTNSPQRYIAHCEGPLKTNLEKLAKAGLESVVFIGPEGDFHPDEIALALKSDFEEVSLGETRLRTETAGIAAVHILQLINR